MLPGDRVRGGSGGLGQQASLRPGSPGSGHGAGGWGDPRGSVGSPAEQAGKGSQLEAHSVRNHCSGRGEDVARRPYGKVDSRRQPSLAGRTGGLPAVAGGERFSVPYLRRSAFENRATNRSASTRDRRHPLLERRAPSGVTSLKEKSQTVCPRSFPPGTLKIISRAHSSRFLGPLRRIQDPRRTCDPASGTYRDTAKLRPTASLSGGLCVARLVPRSQRLRGCRHFSPGNLA